MEGWEDQPLGAVCQFINRGISPAYLESGGVAVLNQKCVRDHIVNFDLGRRHDPEAKKVSPERYVRAGDVLVNSTGTGTLGRVAQLREAPAEPTTVDSHVTIVRAKDGLFYPEFFGYALVSIEEQIQEGGEGCGGQIELSRSKLASAYRIRFPTERSEQRRLVAILDEAFEAIATAKDNTEKNLQNAQTLFAGHVQAVFSQQESGWTKKTVQQWVSEGILAKPQDGNHGEIHPTKADYVDEGVPFIMAADLNDGRVDTQGCRFIARAQAEALRIGFAKSGDVLLSHKGTIGRVAILKTNDDYVILTPQVTYYRALNKDRVFNEFLYYSLLSPEFQTTMKRVAGAGSTRAYIGITRQLDLQLSLPPIDVQRATAAQLRRIEEDSSSLAAICERKASALDELKKSLLHQAFTGQLTAKSTDQQLEAMA
jgi:type I restriction enzyme S subunit